MAFVNGTFSCSDPTLPARWDRRRPKLYKQRWSGSSRPGRLLQVDSSTRSSSDKRYAFLGRDRATAVRLSRSSAAMRSPPVPQALLAPCRIPPHHPQRQRQRVHRSASRRPKKKPADKPSGRHPFTAAPSTIAPADEAYRPRDQRLVERFNRRLAEAIGRQPKRGSAHRLFASRAQRDLFLDRFVHD